MKRLCAALLIWLGLASAALAQNFTMPPPAGVTVGGFVVVASCGSQTLSVGQPAFATMDATGNLCGAASSQITTNPTSTLTLPSTTTAYAAGQLICTNAAAATCNTALASQTFAIANSAGAATIPRLRLTTNDNTSTAWGLATIQIDLWTAAPTFATTGDRGAFTTDFATGTAGHLGAYTCIMSAELGDGAYSECYPQVGNSTLVKLASGTSVFWTAQAVTGSGVTGASKVFTLTAELGN